MGMFAALQCVRCGCFIAQQHQTENIYPARNAAYLIVDPNGRAYPPIPVRHDRGKDRYYPFTPVSDRVYEPVVEGCPARLMLFPDWESKAHEAAERDMQITTHVRFNEAPCVTFTRKPGDDPASGHFFDCPFIPVPVKPDEG